MRHATRSPSVLSGFVLLALLLLGPLTARAQQPAEALQQRYGESYQEVLDKHGDDPAALERIAARVQAGRLARPVPFQQQDVPYAVTTETEPNDFFDQAQDLTTLLDTPTPWNPEHMGGLVQASFDGDDFDVYAFEVDPAKMYYFAGTHSYTGPTNIDESSPGVSMRLFHESDLDTTFVEDFAGITGNDQIRGDILGRTTDHRANSGDFRLTGWTAPIDEATGEPLTGMFYLFVFNGEGGGSPKPIQSLGNSGTYHMSAYAIDLAPWVDKAEPNQTFEEAITNLEAVTLPPDGVARTYVAYNPDTVKVVLPSVSGGTITYEPRQGNTAFPQLLAQGDEDVDHFAITGLKADHTLVVETMPYFGWYREPDGQVGPGNTRWSDPRIRLYNADYTVKYDEDDDGAREVQSVNGDPNNIHSRIVYEVQPQDIGAPLWLWVSAWASATRTRTDGGDPREVDNRDPGRFMYHVYAHQYSNTLDEAAFEPDNDTPEGAMGLAARPDTVVSATFSGAGDVDHYRLFLHEQRMYSLFSQGNTAPGDVQVALYHEFEGDDGSVQRTDDLLAGQDVIGALDGGNFRVGGYVPERSGAYVLEVTGPGAGSYELAVLEEILFPRFVRNEPDDTPDDALAREEIDVGVGAPRQEGVIFPAGDVDHYLFDGVAGQQVTLKLQSAGSAIANVDFDAQVRLLDEDLNELATGEATGEAFSQLSTTLPDDGRYIIQIQAAAATSDRLGNNAVGLYSLNVGDPVRETEPNDAPENATVLLDGFVAASVTPGDVDYYRIAAEAGRIYHVRRANSSLEDALEVDLFLASDPSTSLHDGTDWNGRYGDDDFKVQILPDATQDYLLRLSWPADQSGGGDYEVHIKSTPIDALRDAYEPNDTPEAAFGRGPINPDGVTREAMLFNATNAEAEYAYDGDLYRVDIDEAGGTLTCETLPYTDEFWSRDSDMFARLYDSAGEIITDNDDGGFDWHSKISYGVTEPGTYYCGFASNDFWADNNHTDRDPTTGEYRFQIRYAFEEAEPNDAIGQATPLAAQGALDATFADNADTDVYALDLEPGFIYHVRTFHNGDMPGDPFETTAQLTDASGANVTDTEAGGWRTRNGGDNIKLNLLVEEPTTYYLQLGAPAEIGDGTYQVLMKRTPLDPIREAGEPNNTIDTATPIVGDGQVAEYMLYNPEMQDASLDAAVARYHDDADYYAVDVQAGDTITAETLPFDGPVWPRDLDMYMFLYGPDGAEVATNDDNTVTLEDGRPFSDWHSKIEHVAEEAGTYTILVIGQDAAVPPRDQQESRWRDPARGEYKLRVTIPGQVTTATGDDPAVPQQVELRANYPNPFRTATTLAYALPEATHVRLSVYNVLGQRIETLVDAEQAPGAYTVRFEGRGLASGLYFYRLEAGDFIETRRMLHVK